MLKIGKPMEKMTSKTTVADMALRGYLLMEETNIPMVSEKTNVFGRTTAMRQNSPLVMPPINSGIASTGKIGTAA